MFGGETYSLCVKVNGMNERLGGASDKRAEHHVQQTLPRLLACKVPQSRLVLVSNVENMYWAKSRKSGNNESKAETILLTKHIHILINKNIPQHNGRTV